jgi:hypothetical protein
MYDLLPRMIAVIIIGQHNLHNIIVLEHEGITVHAVDDRVHNDVIRSRNCRVKCWQHWRYVGNVIDDSSVGP